VIDVITKCKYVTASSVNRPYSSKQKWSPDDCGCYC